jgi:hypothetical protein
MVRFYSNQYINYHSVGIFRWSCVLHERLDQREVVFKVFFQAPFYVFLLTRGQGCAILTATRE